jgi:FMN phosphatase YigB (HAD superfamily)
LTQEGSLTDLEGRRCFLLDLGKVLIGIDFRPFGDKMLKLTGLGYEPLREAIMADGLSHQFETGRIAEKEFHAEICRRVGAAIPWDEFKAAWNSIFIPEPLLSDALVSRLAQQRPLWALSNTNALHFDYIRRHFPILRHFTGFVLSFEVGCAKPQPEIFHAALERAGVEPGGALFIDDLGPNVEAARGLGINAFQFLSPDQFVEELRGRHIL